VGQESKPQYSAQFHQILADFPNALSRTLSGKFAIKQSLNIPPHLKLVTTILHKILMSENWLISEIYCHFVAQKLKFNKYVKHSKPVLLVT